MEAKCVRKEAEAEKAWRDTEAGEARKAAEVEVEKQRRDAEAKEAQKTAEVEEAQ